MRVAFLIDGFNVYHSIREAIKDGGGSLKWLDYLGLCKSYLSVFGRDAQIVSVTYFSVYATHLQQSHPDGQVWVAFPFKRFNLELDQTADGTIKIKRAKYLKHQLPDPVVLSDGTQIKKPHGW